MNSFLATHEELSSITNNYMFILHFKHQIEQYLVIYKTGEYKLSDLILPNNNSNIDVILKVVHLDDLIFITDLLFYKDIEMCYTQENIAFGYLERIKICNDICSFLQPKIKSIHTIIPSKFDDNELHFLTSNQLIHLQDCIIGKQFMHPNFLYEKDYTSFFGNYLFLNEYTIQAKLLQSGIHLKDGIFQPLLSYTYALNHYCDENDPDSNYCNLSDSCSYHLHFPFLYNKQYFDSFYELIDKHPNLIGSNITWTLPSNSIEINENNKLESHNNALHKYILAHEQVNKNIAFCLKNTTYDILPNKKIQTNNLLIEIDYNFFNPNIQFLSCYKDLQRYKKGSKQINSWSYFQWIKKIKHLILCRKVLEKCKELNINIEEVPYSYVRSEDKQYITHDERYSRTITLHRGGIVNTLKKKHSNVISKCEPRYVPFLKLRQINPNLNFNLNMYMIDMFKQKYNKNYKMFMISLDEYDIQISFSPWGAKLCILNCECINNLHWIFN